MNDYLREDSWRLVVTLGVVVAILAVILLLEQRFHWGAQLVAPLVGGG